VLGWTCIKTEVYYFALYFSSALFLITCRYIYFLNILFSYDSRYKPSLFPKRRLAQINHKLKIHIFAIYHSLVQTVIRRVYQMNGIGASIKLRKICSYGLFSSFLWTSRSHTVSYKQGLLNYRLLFAKQSLQFIKTFLGSFLNRFCCS
jgi:hypothetical protein